MQSLGANRAHMVVQHPRVRGYDRKFLDGQVRRAGRVILAAKCNLLRHAAGREQGVVESADVDRRGRLLLQAEDYGCAREWPLVNSDYSADNQQHQQRHGYDVNGFPAPDWLGSCAGSSVFLNMGRHGLLSSMGAQRETHSYDGWAASPV